MYYIELMAHASPPPEVPQLIAGSLLDTSGKTQLFAVPVKHPGPRHDHFIGHLPKNSLVTTLGNMAGDMNKCWVKVLSPLGVGWVRLKNLKRHVPGEDETGKASHL